MEWSYSGMCGLQRNTVQVNSISLSSQSESNLLQPKSLTQKKDGCILHEEIKVLWI